MAKVNIRGIGLVRISREVGSEILDFKNDPQYNASDKFVKHGMDFEKRDIGGIILDDFEEDDKNLQESRKEENEEYYRKENKKYEENILARCKRHENDKANNTLPYDVIHQAVAGKPTPEFRAKVIERQKEYYKLHPRHPFAIIEVKDLLPNFPSGNELHISATLPSRVISHVYESMYIGLQTAKKFGYA